MALTTWPFSFVLFFFFFMIDINWSFAIKVEFKIEFCFENGLSKKGNPRRYN